jgi:hypothetical protein
MTVDQAMIKKFDEPFNGDNVNYIDNKTDGNEPVVRPKAGNGDHAGEDTAQNPPEQSAAVQPETASAPPPKAAPSAAKGGQGEKRDGLFSDDEAAALEEQYERSRNIPHFDD